MKQITSIWPKECILCTTQEECNIIMDMMHDAGLTWDSGHAYKEYRRYDFLPEQCHDPIIWIYNDKESYEKLWYTIYPASQFIEQSDFIEKEQASETKRQPKQWERVLVSNHNYDDRVKRIFLCEIPLSLTPYVTVNQLDESDYLRWSKVVRHNTRDTIKQLPNEVKSTYTLELTEEQYNSLKNMILNSK